MSVTANQVVSRADGNIKAYKVAASTHLYEGTLAFLNASGYLDDDTASGVNLFAGVVKQETDNSGGSNGDLNSECWTEGEFLLVGSGFAQTDVQKKCYATDNFTITTDPSAAGAVEIGRVTEYISSTKLRVKIDVPDRRNALGASAPGLKLITGTYQVSAATQNIDTGLTSIVAASLQLQSAPTANVLNVHYLGSTGNGNIQSHAIKCSTGAGGATTPADASSFGDNLIARYIAWGIG